MERVPVLSAKEFNEKVHKLVGNDYTVVTHYINTRTPVELKHNKCGRTFSVRPSNFLYGKQRCPYCAHRLAHQKRVQRNAKKFMKRVNKLYGSKYTVIGQYKNMHTPVAVRHNKCGTTYKAMPEYFLQGESQCPKCFKPKNKRMTTAEFKKQVYKLVGKHYTVLGNYRANYKPIAMRHNDCGREFLMRPYAFLKLNERCPHCSAKHATQKITSTAGFKAQVRKVAGNQYTVLGKYQASYKPIEMKHNVCGTKFSMRPYAFLKLGERCPHCSKNRK